MFHRALLALAVLSLLVLSLAGCGDSPPAPGSTVSADAPGDADGVAAAPPAAPVVDLSPDEPIEPLVVSEEFAPAEASGGIEGIPAPTNTAPIVAIANYYADLPGIDMSSLTPAQHEKFLQRANSELCTCGCKNDTLAKCYINDKTCPVVKDLLLKVLAEVRSGG